MKSQPELRSSAPLGNATAQPSATSDATDAQPASLKALADKVLERNCSRNPCATGVKNNATAPATGSVAGPVFSVGTALECERCQNLDMRKELHEGSRRRFFWRCRKGHPILEAGYRGEWVRLAPPECHDFQGVGSSNETTSVH